MLSSSSFIKPTTMTEIALTGVASMTPFTTNLEKHLIGKFREPLVLFSTLTAFTGSFGTDNGYCWQTLFLERTSQWNEQWPPLYRIKKEAETHRINNMAKFRVFIRHPGFVHVEVHTDGTWTVNDILRLIPDWVLIGGTFLEDAIEDGYTEEFVLDWCDYVVDKQNRGRTPSGEASSFSSNDTGGTKSSTGKPGDKTDLMDILSTHRYSFIGTRLHAIRDYVGKHPDVILTRIDMEFISRALGGYCYSAATSSSEQFKRDLSSTKHRGDTMDTFVRFIKNEKAKTRSLSTLWSKKVLHMRDEHISRYPFDGSFAVSTKTIVEVIEKVIDLRDAIDARDDTAISEAVDAVIEVSERKKKNMVIANDVAKRLEIDFKLFRGRIYEPDTSDLVK